MLKGLPPAIGPELLTTLHTMGHGDRLVLADAHFPGHSLDRPVVRADGLLIAPLLADILELLELDAPENPLAMMEVDAPATADSTIEQEYLEAARAHKPDLKPPIRLPRTAFYQAARSSYAIVLTGDTRPYGNLILTKGVTPPYVHK